MPFRKLSTLNRLLAAGLILALVLAASLAYLWFGPAARRSANVLTWIRSPQSHPDWAVNAGQRCGKAPFILPTSGFIGYIWRDTFRIGHTHQGLDIFGGTQADQTPVVAASSGYLTRHSDWKSSLIIRIPSDPLQPGRQIWTYYTHMADPQGNSFISPDFPPGTQEVFVEAGTLLGYQGNYSGDTNNPTGVHLHFSIVKDNGQGQFLNELQASNTLDPSAYLGLPLNSKESTGEIPVCTGQME